MKRSTLLLAIAAPFMAVVSPASVQPDRDEVEVALTAWFKAFSEQRSEEAFARARAGSVHTPGHYTILSIEDLDAPEIVKKHFREESRKTRNGVMRVSPGRIPSAAAVLAGTPRRLLSDALLTARLPAPPSVLQHPLLDGADVIGMEPSGGLDGNRSSGVTRYFQVKELGVVALNEENFRASGMVIEVFAESINASVNGRPATLALQEDGHGRAQVELAWALDGKMLRLTAIGDGDATQKASVLQEIAAAIKE